MKTIYAADDDGDCKSHYETELAVQEWGLKNNLRLFGITVAEYGGPGKVSKPVKNHELNLKPMAKAYFTDTGFKNMVIMFFDIKETGGKVTVSPEKGKKGVKWPIKVARTKGFENDHIDPVGPLYCVLVGWGIILPFRSTLKQKEWAALPFEDAINASRGNIQSSEARRR